MAAQAGERARKTGDFYCACDEKVHVTQGDKTPKCPTGHSVRDSPQRAGQQDVATPTKEHMS